VAIHHTAGPTSQTPRQIQNHQMDNNGWADIGYNWLVDQQGRIYEGRSGGWLAIGAHAAGQNTAWLGVCWIGTSGTTAPTAAALASLRWLYDEACRRAGRQLQRRGHGQVPGQSTECPGSRLRAWIADGMPTNGGEDQVTEQEINAIAERVHARMLPVPEWMTEKWASWPAGEAKSSSLAVSGYGHARSINERLDPLFAQVLARLAALEAVAAQLLAAPPVDITPAMFADLLEQTTAAARAGAGEALEAVRIDVVDS
jgi:hypothetical protein